MMKNLLTIILMAAVVLTACTKENITVTEPAVDQIVIINATIAGDTKVALGEEDEKKVNWTAGDIINLTIKEVAYSFTWQEGTTFAYTGDAILPALTQDLQITASYAPEFSTTQTGLKADVGNYMALTAEETVDTEKNYGDLNLTFSHGTSVLKLTLKNDDFKGKDVTNITLKAGATEVAKATNTFKGAEADGSVTVYLVLNPDPLTNVTIHATCDSKEYIALMRDKDVESGKIYNAVIDYDDYIDEYGINHGHGVNIDGVVWAPVNCGYHVADYKYGKLYQWGRKYGQGYYSSNTSQNDAATPESETSEGPVTLDDGQSESNKNIFFENSKDWLSIKNNGLWNSGTETSPVKTVYDPCPTGWRVPTKAELSALCANYSSWETNTANNQSGFWLSGATLYKQGIPQVFFSAAGYNHYYPTAPPQGRGYQGGYWSSMADPDSDYAYSLIIQEGGMVGFDTAEISDNWVRAMGFSIRCVQE